MFIKFFNKINKFLSKPSVSIIISPGHKKITINNKLLFYVSVISILVALLLTHSGFAFIIELFK